MGMGIVSGAQESLADAVDGCCDVRQADRLEKVGVEAGEVCPFAMRGVSTAGDGHDLRVTEFRLPSYLLGDVETVSVGESEIKKHEIGMEKGYLLKGRRNRLSNMHGVAKLLQKQAEKTQSIRIVINDKNAHRG